MKSVTCGFTMTALSSQNHIMKLECVFLQKQMSPLDFGVRMITMLLNAISE